MYHFFVLVVAWWLTGNCSSMPSNTSEGILSAQEKIKTQEVLNVWFYTTVVNSNFE